jgi:hypothetical protein
MLQVRDLVRAVGDDVTSRILQAAFRGCAFLNAVSESEHAGHQLRANAARHFVTLRDGAMSAAYLDTPTTAIRTFARGVDRLIRTIDTFP